ncbi:MAG: ComEC/Rec2 family competence protein [Bryobacteraceae bacterium]
MFRITMLPAGHGDAIWIDYGAAAKPRRVLIDGGLVGTYDRIVNHAGSKCTLELLCVTHVDQDHVEGVVKLMANLPPGVEVSEVWFNGYDQITKAARLGAVQGEKLGAAIAAYDAAVWNASFKQKAVVTGTRGPLPCRTLSGGLKLTVLSPRPQELAKLKPVWEKECRKAGLTPGDVDQARETLENDRQLRPRRLGDTVDVEALAGSAYEADQSEANGSSIALLAEFEDKAVLLGADAHSEVLEAGIARLLKARRKSKLKVDAVKVPHHGSKFNNGPALIGMLDSPRWLFSSNGDKFGHPDREAVARILWARRGDGTGLYFNYASEENGVWSSDRLQRDWGYKAHYPERGDEGMTVELE